MKGAPRKLMVVRGPDYRRLTDHQGHTQGLHVPPAIRGSYSGKKLMCARGPPVGRGPTEVDQFIRGKGRPLFVRGS